MDVRPERNSVLENMFQDSTLHRRIIIPATCECRKTDTGKVMFLMLKIQDGDGKVLSLGAAAIWTGGLRQR